ncbi:MULTISPECIES: hypothetical protein [Microbacterium]|uniref:Uncharacterized protein n=1 Tax=Microbacterium testaceum TaxID=2033 RepID=A0A4Y3QH40_MICTE|nr:MULTISPECIES: hypothetical protein [Microbacterium]MDZ5143374.1 hypothetical protein [Microbacterium testaceum]PNW07868.1 hypothetical protein C1632_13805 [Microbacterium testaceum]REC99462.1 hypothetical protein DEU35_0437 [Microbacterium sp. AG157]WJS91819.1 hypothetical protein NYQ11_04495 [Microbacterium testaceum]GEB44472.1 hypothetical protein MTE01_04170 [Microbacterium testaceum]
MTDDTAWAALLDAFERALDAGDEVDPGAFERPAGPPPQHLVTRARDVLERQLRAIEELGVARAELAREIAALRRIPPTRVSAPVYLDVRG